MSNEVDITKNNVEDFLDQEAAESAELIASELVEEEVEGIVGESIGIALKTEEELTARDEAEASIEEMLFGSDIKERQEKEQERRKSEEEAAKDNLDEVPEEPSPGNFNPPPSGIEIDEEIKEIIYSSVGRLALSYLPSQPLDILLKRIYSETLKLDPNDKNYQEKVDALKSRIDLERINYDKIGIEEENGLDRMLFRNPDAYIGHALNNPETGKTFGIRALAMDTKRTQLTGQQALMKALRFMGLGDIVQIPLIHSGFWITIAPLTDAELITYYNKVAVDKTKLGRNTAGFSLGNQTVLTNKDLFDLVKSKIESCSLHYANVDDLMDLIDPNDLRIIEAGLARTMHANGFLFHRACSNIQCDHVAQEMISIDKLLAVDELRLTKRQWDIIGRITPRSVTIEEVKEYQKEFTIKHKGTFTFRSRGVASGAFHFKRPTLREHFDEGIKWIEDVTNQLTRTLGEGEFSSRGEAQLLDQYIRSTFLRQYSHYVDYISIDGSEIRERQDIAEVLANYGTRTAFFKAFVNEVIKFRNSTVVATIGIPEYECPSCKEMNLAVEGAETIPYIIPLDVLNIFFLQFVTKFQMVTHSMASQ